MLLFQCVSSTLLISFCCFTDFPLQLFLFDIFALQITQGCLVAGMANPRYYCSFHDCSKTLACHFPRSFFNLSPSSSWQCSVTVPHLFQFHSTASKLPSRQFLSPSSLFPCFYPNTGLSLSNRLVSFVTPMQSCCCVTFILGLLLSLHSTSLTKLKISPPLFNQRLITGLFLKCQVLNMYCIA